MAKRPVAQNQRRAIISANLGEMIQRLWLWVGQVGHSHSAEGNASLVSIRYHDTVKFLQGRIANPASPFARAEWLQLLEESELQPFLAVAESDDNFAAMPLTAQNGRLETLTNWYNFTWHLADSGDRALLFNLADDLKSKTHRVTLSPLCDENGEASMIESAMESAGWAVLREQCDYNHILCVKGRSFSQYWASRPGQMRTTLKRKSRKVDIEILTSFDDDAWESYETIYQNSWKPEEGDPAFLRQFAKQEGQAGRLRLALARHEGIPVAAQFWTVEDGTAYIHKLAHLEEHKALSAGTTLTAALFEHVIDTDRVEIVDFGTGNDPYKSDWMEEVRPRYRLDCLDPAQPKAWPALAKRNLRTLAGRVAPWARQS